MSKVTGVRASGLWALLRALLLPVEVAAVPWWRADLVVWCAVYLALSIVAAESTLIVPDAVVLSPYWWPLNIGLSITVPPLMGVVAVLAIGKPAPTGRGAVLAVVALCVIYVFKAFIEPMII